MLSFESQDGKDDCASINSCKSIASRQYEDITDAISIWCIVASKGDDGAECQTIREEHLVGGIQPNLRAHQLDHLG